MLSSVCEFNFEVKTRTATKCLSLPLSCVALGSDTQGTHKEQNLLFVRHARGRKLESGVQKNRSIKPKIRWKAKGLPDVWQGQHQVLEVQQALILVFPALQNRCPCGDSGFLLMEGLVGISPRLPRRWPLDGADPPPAILPDTIGFC